MVIEPYITYSFHLLSAVFSYDFIPVRPQGATHGEDV